MPAIAAKLSALPGWRTSAVVAADLDGATAQPGWGMAIAPRRHSSPVPRIGERSRRTPSPPGWFLFPTDAPPAYSGSLTSAKTGTPDPVLPPGRPSGIQSPGSASAMTIAGGASSATWPTRCSRPRHGRSGSFAPGADLLIVDLTGSGGARTGSTLPFASSRPVAGWAFEVASGIRITSGSWKESGSRSSISPGPTCAPVSENCSRRSPGRQWLAQARCRAIAANLTGPLSSGCEVPHRARRDGPPRLASDSRSCLESASLSGQSCTLRSRRWDGRWPCWWITDRLRLRGRRPAADATPPSSSGSRPTAPAAGTRTVGCRSGSRRAGSKW
jgi:hypothetical protein